MAIHVVTYNGYAIPNPRPVCRYRRTGLNVEFTQVFEITASSAAAFTTATQAAEAALNQRNAALTVTWDGQADHWKHDPADGSGLMTRGEIEKVGDIERDGLRIRIYSFVFTCLLPHSESDGDTSGTAEFSVTETRTAANIPSYRFEGEYRQEGTTGALAKYTDGTNGAKAKVLAWLVANATPAEVLDSGSPTKYELANESFRTEDQDERLSYTLDYRYRNIPEKSDGSRSDLFHITSCNQTINYNDEMGFDSPDLGRRYDVEFVIQLDRAQTAYTAIAALYESDIRPFLKKHLEEVWAVAPVSVVTDFDSFVVRAEQVRAGTIDSVIIVNWTVDGHNSQNLSEYITEFEAEDNKRMIDLKLADGKEDTYDSITPGRKRTGRQIITALYVGHHYDLNTWERAAALFPEVGGGWRLRLQRVMTRPSKRHDMTDNLINTTRITVIREYLWEPDAQRSTPIGEVG